MSFARFTTTPPKTVLNLTAPDRMDCDLTEFTLVAGDTVLLPWAVANA